MGIALALFSALIFVAVAVGAWWVHGRAKLAGAAAVGWFDAVAVPSEFFSFPTPTRVSSTHLLDSLGAAADQRSVQVRQRLVPGPLGSERQLMLGMAAELSGRMKIAAAACGVMVTPADSAGGMVRAAQDGSETPELFNIPGPAPWLLGMDIAGNSVAVQPVPGATILALGNIPAPPSHPWFRQVSVGASVSQANGTSLPPGSSELLTAWQDAWDPTVCRVISVPWITDENDPRLSGIHWDVVIKLRNINGDVCGEVTHPMSGYSGRFWPLFSSPSPSPYGHSAVRTARVANARSANSASAG